MAAWLASLPSAIQRAWLTELSPAGRRQLEYDWRFWARPSQREPPGDWRGWLILTGRGWGKTRTAAETIRGWAERGESGRIALVNDTAADVRDIMVEGPAGLLAISPPWNRPTYEPSNRAVTWKNGAVAKLYAAEAPELLRGPEHDAAWVDEPTKWKNLRKVDLQGGTAWDNLLFGLRIGAHPRWIGTATPRGSVFVKALMEAPRVVVTRGTSYENRANLSDDWYTDTLAPYEGTRLGRQEIGGEILDDVPGALWTRALIEAARVAEPPALTRIVVAIDPSVTSAATSAEAGIVVAGLGADGHGYVIEDASLRASPDRWASVAVSAYWRWRADRLVAEVNNGGDMVEAVLRTIDPALAYRQLHASRGKATRAEPVAALYEQGRIHHVGAFPDLEDQLCGWVPGLTSPDRLDALVWALTELLIDSDALPPVKLW